MLFKVSDEEYAVLCEIRKNKSTSPDRLKMIFFSAAEPALKNLEEYDLIRSEISAGRYYYYATEAGLTYCHEAASELSGNNKQKSNDNINPQHNRIKTGSGNKKRKFRTVFNYAVGIFTIIGTIIAFIALIHGCNQA